MFLSMVRPYILFGELFITPVVYSSEKSFNKELIL